MIHYCGKIEENKFKEKITKLPGCATMPRWQQTGRKYNSTYLSGCDIRFQQCMFLL